MSHMHSEYSEKERATFLVNHSESYIHFEEQRGTT
jgi:hypothetical protein